MVLMVLVTCLHGLGDFPQSLFFLIVGSATVFSTADGGATWSQQQILEASNGATGDYFGNSVSLSGNTVVIGAHLDDESTGDAGEV